MSGGSATRLPDRMEGEGLVLRRWEVADAEALGLAVAESLGVLLAWMPWATFEPVPVEKRRQIIGEWEADSAAIPRRLGYTLAAETPKEPVAPGEAGVDLAWHMDAARWARRT